MKDGFGVKNEEIEWLPLVSLVAAMLLWASSFVALKLAFRSYDPMVVIFGRMFLASLFFLPFIPSFRRIRFRRGDLKYLALMALCEPCLYFVFEARAMENTTASQAGMITAMMPLLVAILAWFFLRERISRLTLAGFVLAIVGAVWLSLASSSDAYAPNPLLGNFYEFLAMICAAGYTVSLRHLSAGYPPLFMAAFQSFAGSLFFFPFLLLPQTVLPSEFLLVPALAIAYLGIFVTLVAYTCYNIGVKHIPASQAAVFVNLIPVFSVLMAMLFLGERLNLQQLAASALVLAGVLISRHGGRKSSLQTGAPVTAPITEESALSQTGP